MLLSVAVKAVRWLTDHLLGETAKKKPAYNLEITFISIDKYLLIGTDITQQSAFMILNYESGVSYKIIPIKIL